MSLLKVSVAAATLFLGSVSAQAESNILFVLDASGSMWGKVGGATKMSVAKSALPQLMSQVPVGTKLGLLVYGHRNKTSCEDVELVLPMGSANTDSVGSALKALTPIGKTPIAHSLEQASAAFPAGSEKDSNSIVLISDGIETCDGDPCGVAGKLAAANIKVKVHVVGFDISDKDRAALECIATNGNGKYFPANSPEGFGEAVSEAIQTAQAEPEPAPEPAPAPAPEPAAPKGPARQLYFEDAFSGDDLTEEWEITNPNPDGYIVEDGALLIVNSQAAGFAQPDTPNIVQLKRELPKGDWDLVANFRIKLDTGADQLWLGLRRDENNYIGARLSSIHDGVKPDMFGGIDVDVVKRSNGQDSKFTKTAVDKGRGGAAPGGDNPYQAIQSLDKEGAVLTLSKRGRQFFASLTLNGVKDDQGNPVTVKTDALTTLRVPGPVALAVGKWDGRNPGDTTVLVDKLEVFAVGADQAAPPEPAPKQSPVAPDGGENGDTGNGNSGAGGDRRSERINLLSPKNGGAVLAAPHDIWLATADDKEKETQWLRTSEECIYMFRDESSATFDTFTVFIDQETDNNPHEIELLAGDEGATGQFRHIANCAFENTAPAKSPYQACKFEPVTAQYLKVKLGKGFNNESQIRATEFQLLGELAP